MDDINLDSKGETPIQEFYRGKCVFITGATGFLGKLIIERLSCLCPNLDTIYVLIRSKKGKPVEERLEILLNDKVFEKLRGGWKEKIVALEGQLGEPGLGMRQDDRAVLIHRANVVIHSAATVRFDERMDFALRTNVVGTADVLALCKEMKNLAVLVHVSTAFANCAQGLRIEEKLYEPEMFFDEAIELSKIKDGRSLEFLKSKILGSWPNSYTFTKAVSEYVAYTQGRDLPLVIFRPGIVMGTSGRHSARGYIDSIFGLSGLLVGVGMGVVRVLRPVRDYKTYMVPGDYCVNALLAAAWDGSRKGPHEPPSVINFVPSKECNITWGEIIDQWSICGAYMPTSKAIWWPNVEISHSGFDYGLKSILVHLIPALILDFITRVAGKEPKLLMVHRKIEKFFGILEYFMMREWSFELGAMPALRSRMSAEDNRLFYSKLDDIDWHNYAPTIIHGVRLYLLGDSPKTVPESRRRFVKLKRIHYAIKFMLIAICMLCFGFFIKQQL